MEPGTPRVCWVQKTALISRTDMKSHIYDTEGW